MITLSRNTVNNGGLRVVSLWDNECLGVCGV